jgi:hypothetical protein
MGSTRSDDIRGRWGRLIDNTASFTSLDLSGQASSMLAIISGQVVANSGVVTSISGQISGFSINPTTILGGSATFASVIVQSGLTAQEISSSTVNTSGLIFGPASGVTLNIQSGVVAGSLIVSGAATFADTVTFSGAATFSDGTIRLLNSSGTFTMTVRAPSITQNITGVMPVIPYVYDTVVWKDTTNSLTYAFKKDGSIISVGTAGTSTKGTGADDTVFAAAVSGTPSGGSLIVMPGNYYQGISVVSQVFHAGINVFAYGAVFKYNSSGLSGHTGAIWWRVLSGVRFSVYGPTLDATRFVASVIGGGQNSDMPRLIRVVDTKIKNQLNMAISNGGFASGTYYPNITDIDIRNCEIDTGGLDSVTNECIYLNNVKWVNVENTKLYNHRHFYFSGEEVHVNNIYASASGLTRGQYNAINAAHIDVQDLTIVDAGISFRPAGAGNGTVQEKWDNLHNCSLKNYYHEESVSGLHSAYLEIKGFDDTYTIDNMHISNVYAQRGGIAVLPYPVASGQQEHSKVRNLTIENIYIQEFDTNGGWLFNSYTDIDNLSMKNLYCSGTPAAIDAPIKVLLNDNDMVLNKVNIEGIYPDMAGSNIIVVRQDTGLSARSLTVNFTKPLLKNRGGLSNTSSTVTMKFYENAGKYTASGNASTTIYNISHGLISAPTFVSVQPATIQAGSGTSIITSANSSNLIVTFTAAPTSGNVIFYWGATAG